MNDETTASLWPRDSWMDAIWDSETLKPRERLVAYVYARYAGRADVSWCTWSELTRRTGIKSRTTISEAIGGLVKAGWLLEVAPARQHYSARYQLITPVVQGSRKRTPEDGQQSRKRTAEPPVDKPASSPVSDTSSPDFDASSPKNGPDLSNTSLRHSGPTFGDAPSPDPWRTESPPSSAPRAVLELEPDRSKAGRTEVDRESPVPSARGFALPVAVGNEENVDPFRDVDTLGLEALGTPEALAELRRRRAGGRTTWSRQRQATAHLDPEKRAEVKADLEARRRREAIRAANVTPTEPPPDEPYSHTG